MEWHFFVEAAILLGGCKNGNGGERKLACVETRKTGIYRIEWVTINGEKTNSGDLPH